MRPAKLWAPGNPQFWVEYFRVVRSPERDPRKLIGAVVEATVKKERMDENCDQHVGPMSLGFTLTMRSAVWVLLG